MTEIDALVKEYGALFRTGRRVYFYSKTDADAFARTLTPRTHPEPVSEYTSILYVVTLHDEV